MAVCSFMGHINLYDWGLEEKLRKAVAQLVRGQEEVEFLFPPGAGAFHDLCAAAALEAKQRHPDKKITLTLVVRAEEREKYTADEPEEEAAVLACMADRVISPPDGTRQSAQRWTVERSTHFISYFYAGLHVPEARYARLARSRGLTVTDLTDPETAAFIARRADGLEEDARRLLRGIGGGRTLKELAQEAGVCVPTVRRRIQRACGTLRRQAEQRRLDMAPADAGTPAVCGVFALGRVTDRRLYVLEQTALYLVRRYHVTRFEVAEEYCHSGYMQILRSISEVYRDVRIVGITRYPEPTQEAWRLIVSDFVPPCHEVENFDPGVRRVGAKMLRLMKFIIKRSDFCLCALADNAFAESICRTAAKCGGVKLLDMSRGGGEDKGEH